MLTRRIGVAEIKKAVAAVHRCEPGDVSIVVESKPGGPPELYAVLSRQGAATEIHNPPCAECGSITTRAGSCFLCANCGATSGCS